jgi:hypothetical protein
VVVVARRKAQEERDLELARQLDRELNLDELESERAPESRSGGGNWGGGSDPGMPGGW